MHELSLIATLSNVVHEFEVGVWVLRIACELCMNNGMATSSQAVHEFQVGDLSVGPQNSLRVVHEYLHGDVIADCT